MRQKSDAVVVFLDWFREFRAECYDLVGFMIEQDRMQREMLVHALRNFFRG